MNAFNKPIICRQKIIFESQDLSGHGGKKAYVFVIDQLHQLEFPVGPLRVRNVLKRSRQFLDRDILRCHRVVRRAVTNTFLSKYTMYL